MKSKLLLTAGLLSLATSTALLAQEVKLNIPGRADAPAVAAESAGAPGAPTVAPATTGMVSEAEIMESFGWFVAARIGIAELEFTPKQVESFVKGVAQAAAGQQPPHDLKTVGPIMDEFIGKRQAAALEREKQQNLVTAKSYFEALKKRPGIKSTSSGLCYEILVPGQGANAKADDTVKINYKGMLIDGQVFDSSEQHGEALTIEVDKAIPGWAEGIQQINKGGKIKLYIPPQLAYGDEGAGSIPPGSALIFEIEVLDISATPPAPAAAAPAAK